MSKNQTRAWVLRGCAVALLVTSVVLYLPRNTARASQITVSFAPDADALVKQLFPGNNYGSYPQLRTDGFPIVRSYLRFSVSGLAGLTISKAQLQIHANSNSRVGLDVHAVADSGWSEGTLNYWNAPAVGPLISSSGPFAAGNWVPIDVSSYVTGEGIYSFAISTSGVTAVSLSSRETGANTPRLVLLLTVPEAPTDTPTAAFTDTPVQDTLPAPTDTPAASPTDTPAAPPTDTATTTPEPTFTATDTPAPSDTPTLTPTATATNTPTATPGPAGAIQHVFLVMMENRGYDQVWNASTAPYISYLGNSYVRASNYHAVGHPSLPNYLSLVAGTNAGITTDCEPSPNCHASVSNLGTSLEAAGLSWKAYQESMPAPCYLSGSGGYVPRHNPFIYFDDIRLNADRCNSHDVPYSALSSDLSSAGSTPNFALITPNLCNDMHDCAVSTGDTWLQNNLSQILLAPACVSEKCLVMLAWDEDDGNAANHVLVIFAGSGAQTGGAVSSAPYNHFSLLRTVEYIFGLPTLTANDASASPMLDMLR